MLKLPFIRIKRRGEKRKRYSIVRDELGRSARQRAFEAFDHGLRPAQVAREENIKPRTAYKYFTIWKKLPANFTLHYSWAKKIRHNPVFSEEIVLLIGEALGMSRDEVIERLQKPWAIKQLMMGKWPNHIRERAQSEAEARLKAALVIVSLIEHSEKTPEEEATRVVAMISRIREKVRRLTPGISRNS